MLQIALLSCAALIATVGTAPAQSGSQRQRCLQEAAAQGLGAGPEQARGARASRTDAAARDRRQAFMDKCMAQRPGRPAPPPATVMPDTGSYQ